MTTFNNPFSIDRAEQLGDNLFEFFAYHKSFEGLLKHKSLIIKGGRGSGKTMFFLYHTYDNKKKEAFSKQIPFSTFLGNQELIGIHFRCNSNFVPAFQHKGIEEEEWSELFAHYLNINLSKRLVEVVIDINNNLAKNNKDKINFEIQNEVEGLFKEHSIIDSFESFLKTLTTSEIAIVNYINNTKHATRPNIIFNGYLLNILAKSIIKQKILKGKTIHIFIDEYENLLSYQQKILNTLIKHPDPVIFDVGMRNEGHKIYQTLSDTEIISAPHDFHLFNFEELTDDEYEELIIKICEKRLRRVDSLDKIQNDNFFNIKYYLGEYSIEDEVNSLIGKEDIQNLKLKIKTRIGHKKDETKILYETNDPIILRLNQVLLERGEKIETLTLELQKYYDKKTSKYSNWVHNNKMGVVFLLCREKRKKKSYYGFNTYKSVSSGIIRYFIELCESAFKNAYRNGFTFSNPRALTSDEQTNAAFYVSKYKVNDIETYTPNSIRLHRFVMLLGKIFNTLHNDKKLSEPERNHFSTEYDKLSNDSRRFIKNAILYSVLQRREKTKVKTTGISSDNNEFHLNHIYAPYFQISARRIRSIYFKPPILEGLILGDVNKATDIANAFVKDKLQSDNNQLQIEL